MGRLAVLGLVGLVAAGCQGTVSDVKPPDAGPVDAGGVDAGGVDAGGVDAGGVDAGGVDGGGVDGGGVDAGGVDGGAVDAGGVDAGEIDAGPVDAGARGIYGMGIMGDGLANAQVGGPASGAPNTKVAYRFRAEQSSALNSFAWYCVNQAHPGYGGGNGGTLVITVQTDTGGFPSGTVLASTTLVGPPDSLQVTTFSTPATLTAGTLYELVFENTDPNPTVNFVSTDSMWVAQVLSPHQPRYADLDWGQSAKYGAGPWQARADFTPILGLNYANGVQQGMGYMESSITSAYGTITGSSSMVREAFTVTGGDRTVTAASVRLSRSSGTDPLVVRLETAAGALVEAVSVPAASIAVAAPGTEGASLVTAPFLAPHLLANGQAYHLRLSTAAGTTYTAFTLRKGVDYFFTASTFFSDGQAQKTTNGSTWSDLGRVAGQEDLQFFFTVQ